MSESTGNSSHATSSSAGPAAGSSPAPTPLEHAPQTHIESAEELAYANRPFRGWRLLGVIAAVVVVLAIVSAVVDWMVIGPLEGRMF